MRHVFLYNASAVTADDANAYAAAQEAQLRQDYAPAYDGDGALDTVRALPTTATQWRGSSLAVRAVRRVKSRRITFSPAGRRR